MSKRPRNQLLFGGETPKILLVSTDSKIPNIPLMKLSTFHKDKGDMIELLELRFTGYPHNRKIEKINALEYDKVYISTVFPRNKDKVKVKYCGDVVWGGTGIDPFKWLPEEIEGLPPDYSLYPDNDISFGFCTRGCVRKCDWCFVPKKEGMIHFVQHPKDFIVHQKVELLDNNFLSYDKHEDILKWFIEWGGEVNINQGLDIRFINDSNAELLSKLNYPQKFTFAFDDIKYESAINRKLALIKKYISNRNLRFYVLVGFTDNIKDDLYRVFWCINNGVYPYVMRHENFSYGENKQFYAVLAAWANQPQILWNWSYIETLHNRINGITDSDLIRKIEKTYRENLPENTPTKPFKDYS